MTLPTFAPTTYAAIDDFRLTKDDLALYLAYLRHIRADHPVCWPGQERLCQVSRLSRDLYRRSKRRLLDFGWISQTPRRDDQGRFSGWLVRVHFTPADQNGGSATPIRDRSGFNTVDALPVDGGNGAQQDVFLRRENTLTMEPPDHPEAVPCVSLGANYRKPHFPESSIVLEPVDPEALLSECPTIDANTPPHTIPCVEAKAQSQQTRQHEKQTSKAAIRVTDPDADSTATRTEPVFIVRKTPEASTHTPLQAIPHMVEIDRQVEEGLRAGAIRNPAAYRRTLIRLDLAGQYQPPGRQAPVAVIHLERTADYLQQTARWEAETERDRDSIKAMLRQFTRKTAH
jgi:hypothetical protein